MKNNKIVELWINEIIRFISSNNIDSNLINEVEQKLKEEFQLIKEGMVTNEIFGAYEFGTDVELEFTNECRTFINYLEEKIKVKKKEYIEFGINYSLNCNSNLSFIDNFIRYIVITNYNDIKIVDDMDIENLLNNVNDYNEASGSLKAYLGGFLLCDISSFSAHQDKNNNKYLDFYNLHSRKNTERMKVGTLLIKKLLEKMLTNAKLKDFSLGSGWVMKNNSVGKKFYEKNGFVFLNQEGKIVNYDYYDDYIEVERQDYQELTDEEFSQLQKKMDENFFVMIPSSQKQKILDTPYEIPYIEFLGKKIDCYSDITNLETKKHI